MRILFAFAVLLSSCGSTPPAISPCLTKGATYLFRFAEGNAGTCGALPDQIVNIGQDGKPAGANNIGCEAASITGCSIQNTKCKATVGTTTCTSTTSMDYTQDGASGGGLQTTTCTTPNASCVSSYQVTALRQ